MAIHKGPVREKFTQIPNATHQDTSLSLQCRGLLGYLISLPDDWVIRPEQLAKANGIAKNTAYKLIKEKKVSESTVRARDFSANQSEIFAERVMAELLTSNLPERKHRYAQLKIKEFQERFPESASVADCYSYVEQAVIHQIALTGP